MTAPQVAIGRLLYVVPLGYSPNGNQRYSVIVMQADGSTFQGRTAPNSSAMNGAPRSGMARVTWHRTPSGRQIVDRVEHLKD